MKGALDVVLRHCTTLADGSLLTLRERDSFIAKSRELGEQGLRGIYRLSLKNYSNRWLDFSLTLIQVFLTFLKSTFCIF